MPYIFICCDGRQPPNLDKVSSSKLEMKIEVWKEDIKTLNVNLSEVDTDLASRRVGVNGMAKDMFTFTFKV